MMALRLAVVATALAGIGGIAIAQQQQPARRGAAERPAQQQGASRQGGARSGALTPAPEQDTTVILMREVFAYERAGRRDPFAPLLQTEELRPALNELRLTSTLVHPTRPIAVMRDKDGTQYRVTVGMTVGRARVVEIKRRSVIFRITEYGYDRLDSLVLGDTAQVRP